MGIGISNRAQETYQYQTEAGATKHGYPHAVKLDALSIPGKTNRRDVFEHSDSNRVFTGYDALDIEEIESIRYKVNHTIIHTPSWFSGEAGEELQKIKEEKGTYNGSDILNAYGFTYARLYAEIEQRYENSDEQWFGLGGEPLTKEKETEELEKAYENAVDWATKCAEVMAGIHFQKADTQPGGLYRYGLRLPNQPKHKSPPNGLTDFLRGFASRSSTGSQGGNVNDPASVIIPLYLVWCTMETSDMIKIIYG